MTVEANEQAVGTEVPPSIEAIKCQSKMISTSIEDLQGLRLLLESGVKANAQYLHNLIRDLQTAFELNQADNEQDREVIIEFDKREKPDEHEQVLVPRTDNSEILVDEGIAPLIRVLAELGRVRILLNRHSEIH